MEDYEDDLDNIDYNNYKGIFFGEENPSTKYQCPETGAHFDYKDIVKRLNKLSKELVWNESASSNGEALVEEEGVAKTKHA